jgi:riboflavin synthase
VFTGIVEELGEVTRVEPGDGVTRLAVRGPVVTEDAKHGDSIAVNGVCLTVVEIDGDEFTVDVVPRRCAGRASTGWSPVAG